ncbi:MAG: ABC transporter ATP-binding protein [Deltaproteobacteria bacterium]|nr:ABC transporter ATP-binding protein [Deltaproteobacteria bacterium]
MAKVTIENLRKEFGEVLAVDNLNLLIEDGELMALLGPSGCGKTTTLRCIAGLEEPQDGHVYFDEQDVTFEPPERKNVGIVFQNYALFPHMTIFQNIAFGLKMIKLPKKEVKNRVEKALEMVHLKGYEDRFPHQLSGGQQQRVALSRAMVIEPQLLLLDEPLANLDAKLREEMRFFVRSVQKEIGITAVYVTHDQAESMVIADRVAVMFDGKIEQIGTPYEIYKYPSTRRVADFIGLVNLMPGKVRELHSGGICSLLMVDTGDTVKCRYKGKLSLGDEAILVVRPESIKLRLLGEKEVELDNYFEAEVKEKVYLGNLMDYRLQLRGDISIRVQEDPWISFEIGDRVLAAFSCDETWLIKHEDFKE